MTELFIMRDFDLHFGPEFCITFDEAGQLTAKMDWHVHLDVFPIWLGFALDHVKAAALHRQQRITARQAEENEAFAEAMQMEFRESLQAVVAIATAVDALYSSIQPTVVIPKGLRETWSKNRTPRSSQVSETFKRAYRLNGHDAQLTFTLIKELYRLRDRAVHPTVKSEAPVAHPEVDIAVPWYFAAYRSTTAETLVMNVCAIVRQIAYSTQPDNKNLIFHFNSLRQNMDRLTSHLTLEQPLTRK